ncbi:DUF802 domain-containing protein, partial [Stenotrophomonas maltophilia]
TVQTLLDAINHASHEQRTAVDALVGGSAELLERVGNRFTDHIAAETGKLDGTVQTLLDAINHASHEQRTAVDALVGGSAELLER